MTGSFIFASMMVITITGCGLMAGLFFVFSVSVMKALAQMPPHEGLKAMQLINRTILNPIFLGTFFGTALLFLCILAVSVIERQPGYGWSLSGAAIYLVGGFLVTVWGNVPLNNALDTEGCPEYWGHYLKYWTRWNHLRTAASVVAVILLATGLL
jgi:uncharacterized membrane protein